ncbi:DUF4097 family beta strand repeat-containing protein [Rhizomonospora bruguierae]|uniref:DUF4097 family beta strand repeat-containing protein n=1 Tax=Rhizomonospora bruguierae TaxID=1581705 RepID=UPI001BCF674D|nr:DUF4097 family beta strand repeat-containing protein [Micromonospora sp. NBRC 107566]
MTTWLVDKPQRLAVDRPVRRLDVRLISGKLNVVGADGPPRIEVTSIGTRPLVVSCEDGALVIRYERPRFWPVWTGPLGWFLVGRKRYRAEVSVAVPPEAVAELELISGSAVVSALRAGASITVSSGRITLLGLAGQTVAKVVSGPVEALGVGGDLEVETVSGELIIADSSASRLRARTTSGPITADLNNPPYHSRIDLETVSGQITARVREDSDLDVELHTVSGRVSSDFEELWARGSHGDKRLGGRLGAGTGRLRAQATSGHVSLLARQVDDEERQGAYAGAEEPRGDTAETGARQRDSSGKDGDDPEREGAHEGEGGRP